MILLASKINIAELTIGQVFGAFFIVFAVVFAVYKGIKAIYDLFLKAHNAKKNEESFKETVEVHSNEIQQINNKIDTLVDISNKLMEVNKIQTRHYIVESCTDAIGKGEIEQYQLQSIEDMYSMYKDVLHGNSYVSTLVKKIRRLQIKNND